MKVRITVTGKLEAVAYFHDIEGEGDLSEAIGIAIKQFREANPEASVFDSMIKIDRA